ncbi:MAG: DUF3575 domain-containing protein [Marinifilaceae bacterium]
MRKTVVFIFLFMGLFVSIPAQKVGIKTNLLYDATTTFNLGVDVALSNKWSLDVSANYNPWTFSDNKKWKHWLVQPEARYWLCEKFNGNFFGVHLLGTQYNFGNWNTDFKFLGTNLKNVKDYRIEGWGVGAGVTYGHSWVLNKHFNLEAALGIGYLYMIYDRYQCPRCGEKIGKYRHNYVGPTKAALNLIYYF